jgi:hypothetical protein
MTPAASTPVKYAGRNYVVEVAVVSALYVGAAVARHWLIDQAPTHDLKIAAALVPSIPVWMLFGVVWRYYRAIDELERHKFLVTLAISFGIGSCLLVSWSFLTDAGLTAIDITWAWPTLAVTWGLTTGIRRIADHL